ncbi:MAG: hypothetical protein AAGH57_03775 [Pseudomonadota bacterium]
MRVEAFPMVLSCLAGLWACAPEPVEEEAAIVNAIDPYVARALNDPLMVDPDLAYRNEANAAITIGYDHALPSFKGSAEAASRAREASRLALLEEGSIADLPEAQDAQGPGSLAKSYTVATVLEDVRAPMGCREGLVEDFAIAADMPEFARLMPHGMVRVAAMAEQPECALHVVRYTTPASIEDALQHHYTIAQRAGIRLNLFAEPERSLVGKRDAVHLNIFARETLGELNAVDVVVWVQD